MRRLWTLGLAACLGVAGSSLHSGAAHAQQAQDLTVIVYGGSFEEGWRRAVIEPFERANPGIRIRIATGLTMQTVAMMRAQRADPRIDVIMMDEVGAAQANAEGLFEPLTLATVPNMADLHPRFRIAGDPYTKFMYVAQVIAYDKTRITTPPSSYRDLWRPEYRNRLAIPDINTSHGVMLLLMTARMGGGGERNIDPGFVGLRELRPSIVTFWNQHAQVAQMFTQGDIWITTWTSDRTQGLIDSGGNVGWVIPQEGAYIIDSTIGIARGTKRLDAAQRYINYVLSVEAQAANARHTYLTPVNRKVQLPEDVARKLPAGEATLDRLLPADWSHVTTQLPQWTDRWNREITTR
ncbi:ABC transporter substrate-binding protein [Elioraea sp.]|uniref:ABC transporter substrate-binding protein n=1 Tax=Elioraea sp. TaxID=2185103 RepID=UPI0025C216DE|nr:ABC transporter substrate-binding protein [Elioraea sp.]